MVSFKTLELRRKRRKRADGVNCLQEILIELMNDRRVQIVDIHRATGIPFSTLQDWITCKSKTQKLDANILALSKFFNVSINYLAYGIGEADPIFDNETDKNEAS